MSTKKAAWYTIYLLTGLVLIGGLFGVIGFRSAMSGPDLLPVGSFDQIFVLDSTNGLKVYRINETGMTVHPASNLPGWDINGTIPLYDEKGTRLFVSNTKGAVPEWFVGVEEPSIDSFHTFAMRIANGQWVKEHVVDGQMLSISPSGTKAIVRQWENGLSIVELADKSEKKLGLQYDPSWLPVWASDQKLLVYESRLGLQEFDTETEERKKVSDNGFRPVAISGNRMHLLGKGPISASGAGMMGLSDYTLEGIDTPFLTSVGPVLVWGEDDSGYLYSRTTHSNLKRLVDIPALFFRTLERRETEVASAMVVYSGVGLPQDFLEGH